MHILYLEASKGWGGQEIRILREALGMQKKGYTVTLVTHPYAELALRAQEAGLKVHTLPLEKRYLLHCLWQLRKIMRKGKVDLINTHSSSDAWIGGVAGKLWGCPVVRTRHLSTAIRKGANSRLLYNYLANKVVTTCEEVVEKICMQAKLPKERCCCIPTGVEPASMEVDPNEVDAFREKWGIAPDDCLVGTLCVLRSWKGVTDFIHACQKLQAYPKIKWMVVGNGPAESYFKEVAKQMGVEEKIIFTGHLIPPFAALAAMDIFLLLSTSNEGVSQATLQAAYFGKPLITTATGGLREVCLPGKTGFLVACHAPGEVAERVLELAENPLLRMQLGAEAKALVIEKYTFDQMIDSMVEVYSSCLPRRA